MAVFLWTILVATMGVLWFLSKRRARHRRMGNLKEAPGPIPYPIVGNAHQLGVNRNTKMCEWSVEYGDIFQIQLGSMKTYVISNAKWAKEIFSNDPAFAGRFGIPAFEMYYPEHSRLGILASEGERWEVHRRFLLRQLRDFGFGKSSMEALIMEEVTEIIERFKKAVGKPVRKVQETFRLAIVNSFWSILLSKRFEQDDPELLDLANNTSETFNEVFEKAGVLALVPWLMHLFPEGSGYNSMRKVLDDNRKFIEKEVNERKERFKNGDENDFVDMYLAEMEKNKNDPKSLFYGEVAEKQLITTLFDLFIAGNDTTSVTLAWAVNYIVYFPNVQTKLQQEISEITGDSRKVSVDDRANMPYTIALIDEILRYSSIVQDGVQHRAMADSGFKGYFIEKDAVIQPNLYYIHHDKKLWGDPENFRPERFLSPDGKKYVKREELQAFQAGRRACVGESLARDSIFLHLTNLFQQFKMEFNPNFEKKASTLEAKSGFLRSPFPYEVIMTNRLKN